jgi:type I restriction enzyme R subunit
VDQEHASEMRRALINLNADLVAQHSDYVCRVTADEGDIGKGKLSAFQDLDRAIPVILTTSQLLTTGVDAPTCKNVVLARVVGSMSEFKQIIGRGTRLREDYGKLYFNILDYTGTATAKFADPDFDGEPNMETITEIDPEGDVLSSEEEENRAPEAPDDEIDGPVRMPPDEPRKFYVDGGTVEIVAHLVYDLDTDGKRLTCHKLTDWTGEKVRTIYPTAAAFRAAWCIADKRQAVIEELAERGIDLETLAEDAGRPDDDPFDLLCHLAWNAHRLDTGFLGWFAKTPAFFAQVAAQGSTNYAAVRPTNVLKYVMPLPPLRMQHRIVAQLDSVYRGRRAGCVSQIQAELGAVGESQVA